MASNFYTIGRTTYRRERKQGAHPKPESLLRRNAITVRLTDAEYAEYLAARKSNFLRSSDFAALVFSAGIKQLFASDNCSKS